MFSKESAAARYFDEGKRAALDDQPPRVPGHIPQAGHKSYLDGHAKGRTMLNVQRAEGFRPLADVVNTIVPNGGAQPEAQQAA